MVKLIPVLGVGEIARSLFRTAVVYNHPIRRARLAPPEGIV